MKHGQEIHENGHFNGHLNGKIMNIIQAYWGVLGDFPTKHVSFLVVNEFQLLVLDR